MQQLFFLILAVLAVGSLLTSVVLAVRRRRFRKRFVYMGVVSLAVLFIAVVGAATSHRSRAFLKQDLLDFRPDVSLGGGGSDALRAVYST